MWEKEKISHVGPTAEVFVGLSDNGNPDNGAEWKGERLHCSIVPFDMKNSTS